MEGYQEYTTFSRVWKSSLEAGRSEGRVEEAQQWSRSWHSLTKIWLQKDISATVVLN